MKIKSPDGREGEYYWNLKELLYQHRITRTQDYKDKLAENGLVRSYAACHDLMHKQPKRVTLSVILATCKMLDCSVSDLFVVRYSEPSSKSQKVVSLMSFQKQFTGVKDRDGTSK